MLKSSSSILEQFLPPFVEERRVYPCSSHTSEFGLCSIMCERRIFTLFRSSILASFSVAHAAFPGYEKVGYS
jgi:hypothetical protein